MSHSGRTEFNSFEACLAALPRTITARYMQRNSTELAAFLAAQGFRKFSILSPHPEEREGKSLALGGSSTVVLQLGDRYVLRFLPTERMRSDFARAFDMHMIQPAYAGIANALAFEILPVLPENVTPDAYKHYLDVSHQAGFSVNGHGKPGHFVEDAYHKGDIRCWNGGAAYGVDAELLIGRAVAPFDKERDAAWLEPASTGYQSMFPDVPAGLRVTQESRFPEIVDFKQGKPRLRGVLTNADRTVLESGDRAAFNALRRQKPECFTMLKRCNPEDAALAETEEGLRQLYQKSLRAQTVDQDFFHLSLDNKEQLQSFIHRVFDEGQYPAEAMRELSVAKPIPTVAGGLSLQGRIQYSPHVQGL